MVNDPNYKVTVNGDIATVRVTNPETKQVETLKLTVGGDTGKRKDAMVELARQMKVSTAGSVKEIYKRIKVEALVVRRSFIFPGTTGEPFDLDYAYLKHMSGKRGGYQWQFGRPQTANLMTELRTERNRLLAETDHWVLSDTVDATSAQTTYRQALRDITDNATSLDDVVWPEKP